MNHCPGCHGHVYDEQGEECAEHTFDVDVKRKDCPGCPECVRLKALGTRMCQALGISTDMDEEALVKACEEVQDKLNGLRGQRLELRNTLREETTRLNGAVCRLEDECERLRAELLSVRESLLRERAGQGKCNSGHVSDRALWDCPVCVEAMRARLTKAERVVKARAEFDRTDIGDIRTLCARKEKENAERELSAAKKAWEQENG